MNGTNFPFRIGKPSCGQRNAGGSHDAGHAQDLGIFFVGERADSEARILQKFYFAQQTIFAQLNQRHLARQPLDRAQIHHHLFRIVIVRVGIGIAAHFRQRVHRMLRLAVVAKRAVASLNLL
jgi:hypothetical protein